MSTLFGALPSVLLILCKVLPYGLSQTAGSKESKAALFSILRKKSRERIALKLLKN
jgi:hypothetical protein